MNPKFHDLVVTHWGARFMGYTLPVAVGRSGIAEKIGEGDGITPIGNFSIKTIGFRNDRISFNASNIVKKHTKPTKENKGGIISKESFIHQSNIKNIDVKKKENKQAGKK